MSDAPKLDWPVGKQFRFFDEPGEHDPCYVVMPDGAMLPVNHHAATGVDIARAKWIVAACNAALTPDSLAEAARALIAARCSTYKARNGRDVGIEDSNGEKCWIVPFDEMADLERALVAPSPPEPAAGGVRVREAADLSGPDGAADGAPWWADADMPTAPESAPSVADMAAEIARLREALEPFAAVADEYDDGEDDHFEVWVDAGPERTIRSTFELRKYRRARAALKGATHD
jgi:hypothetical protein